MKPDFRYDWIERHMRENPLLKRGGVDILNSDFVDSYCDATKAPFKVTMWGAYKCPQLGRDLGEMYKRGILKRWRCGLSNGAWQPGFPKWVWSYQLRFE